MEKMADNLEQQSELFGGSEDASSVCDEERVRKLFQACDGDGDGYIDRYVRIFFFLFFGVTGTGLFYFRFAYIFKNDLLPNMFCDNKTICMCSSCN